MESKGGYLYQQLTYNLIKLGYTVFNRLQFGYQEKYYQRAYEEELKKAEIQYEREKKVVIIYNGKSIGRYFIDFVVDQKVVVELKVAANFHPKHISQVLGYLKARQLRLGIILLFTQTGIKIKRIIN